MALGGLEAEVVVHRYTDNQYSRHPRDHLSLLGSQKIQSGSSRGKITGGVFLK